MHSLSTPAQSPLYLLAIIKPMATSDNDNQIKRILALKDSEEEDLLKHMAEERYGLPYIDLTKIIIENDALRIMTEETARALEMAPFDIKGKEVKIAVRAPARADVKMALEEFAKRGFRVSLFVASTISLNKVFDRYKEVEQIEKVKSGSLDVSAETLADTMQEIKSIEDIEKLLDEALTSKKAHATTRIVEVLFSGAIALDASDIHIEPEENDARIRFRLDGVLHEVARISKEIYDLLNSRAKLLSGLKLIKNKAQDGRFSIFLGKNEINIRTSIVPGGYGESLVFRLLNPKSINVKIGDLGIEPKLLEVIEQEIRDPNGLILITGPTGSGKTTTLYAFLQRIYSVEKKIITIEDPIEYHLAGITQTQTDSKKGYSFAEGLRSALRQDPEIIMVGEIRDGDTAKTAVEAALTGHLVFSTLHTNNAGGVIPRLIDLEVNPKILVSALSLSIAQRLVRKLCNVCKKKREPTKEEFVLMKNILAFAKASGKNLEDYGIKDEDEIFVYEAIGCPKCANLGYKGRIGIFEAIICDQSVQNIIPNNPSEREIAVTARPQGILNMREDGIIKALKGVTSLEEVKSVVDVNEEV